MSTENKEQDNSNNQVEALAAELSKANRTIQSLEREKRRVGLSFHRIPESGYQISRLWEGDFPYLQKLPTYSYEKTPDDPTFKADANTVLIEADNLAALMTLQLTHKGKIDVIYIDPPYNTGNSDFIFNDARKSSLKDVEGVQSSDYEANLDGKARTVGKDDPERHSLWLSFMERRLWLAKDLLSPSGFIIVAIDDNEHSRLNLLMESVFGESNFLADVSRLTKSGSNQGNFFAPSLDYMLFYAKDINRLPQFSIPTTQEYLDRFKFSDTNGQKYLEKGLYQSSLDSRPNQRYWIECPDGSFVIPPGNVFPSNISDSSHVSPIDNNDKVWRWSWESYKKQKDMIIFKETKNSPLLNENRIKSKWNIYVKQYLERSLENGTRPRNLITDHPNANGGFDIKAIGVGFSFAKPVDLIKYVLSFQDNPNAIILDFFAGSGTTAHAVAELNKEDGGNRQCILVTHGDENGKNIAADITAERMKRVLSGENWADGKEHEALPGSLYYYKLLFAPKTRNPLTAMETMQSRFTGIASLEQDAHVIVESESNYAVLRNSKKVIIVWKNQDALLEEPDSEFIPLMKKLKAEYPEVEHIVYTPSTNESSSDEYGVEQYGWINYSYPVEYLSNHDSLLERMKRNKTMLQPFVEISEENTESQKDVDSQKDIENQDVEEVETVYFNGEAK